MRPTRSAAALVTTGLLLSSAGCTKPTAAAAPPAAAPPLDPTPPTQVEFPTDRPEAGDAEADREAVSRFAWKLFVAVNWPAKATGPRGIPDPANPYRDTSGPTVWGTWKSQDQLYPEKELPKGWDEADPAPTLSGFDKAWKRKQYRVKELPETGAGRVKVLGQLTAVNQADVFGGEGGQPLVDQAGKLVRYEVRMNRVAYNTIYTRKLYLRAELNKLSEFGGVFDDQSINVKAAWKELPDDQAVRGRYYHTEAQALVGWKKVNATDYEAVTEKRLVGLVGLHVVTKVAGRKSWVWSTFEQVDNLVPPPGAAVASFRNPALIGAAENTTTHRRIGEGDPLPTIPVQVGRKEELHAAIRKVNDEYRPHPGLAGTPWKYYQLVGVQWAREKKNGGLEDEGNEFAAKRMLPPRPQPVLNVTMETFRPGSTCLGCHGPSIADPVVGKRRFLFVFYPDTLALSRPD